MSYILLPRKDAIKIADLERDSLWMRHKLASIKCKPKWKKAARAADKMVDALENENDRQAINYMYKVGRYWFISARCGPVERIR